MHPIERLSLTLEKIFYFRKELLGFLVAACEAKSTEEIVFRPCKLPGFSRRLDLCRSFLEQLDCDLQISSFGQHFSLLEQDDSNPMAVLIISVEQESLVRKVQGFPHSPLVAPKGALEVQDFGLDPGISTCAPSEASLRLAESGLGAPKLSENPAGVSQVGISPGAEIEDPIPVIRLSEMTGDPHRRLGQIQRLGRSREHRFEAFPEEEMAEPPRVQLLLLLDHPHLLVQGMRGEPGEKIRGLAALVKSDLLIPMPDLPEQALDLLMLPLADGATLQKVGHHLAEDVLLLQAPRQPLRKLLQGQMRVLQAQLLSGAELAPPAFEIRLYTS